MNILPECQVYIPSQIGYILTRHIKIARLCDVINKVTKLMLKGIYKFRWRRVYSDDYYAFAEFFV